MGLESLGPGPEHLHLLRGGPGAHHSLRRAVQSLTHPPALQMLGNICGTNELMMRLLRALWAGPAEWAPLQILQSPGPGEGLLSLGL